MAISYTYYKLNEDGSKTLLTLAERWALFKTWLLQQSAEDQAAYTASAARTKEMVDGYDISVAVHPPVDPVWKEFWNRFLVEAGVEQVLADA